MQLNTEQFGISFKYAIGKKYKLDVLDLKHRTDDSLVDKFLSDDTISNIFKKIKTYPIQAVYKNKDYIPNGATRSPHNFLLKNGKTLSIKTNVGDNRKQCPNVIGQPGFKTFDYHFGDFYEGGISPEKFKTLVLNDIDKIMPIYLDFLFISDYTVWVYCEKSDLKKTILDRNYIFEVIERGNIPELEWNKEDFTFKNDILKWADSNTVYYKGKSIGEFQVHKESFLKFRIDMFEILPLIKEKIETNETLGISAEYAICKHYNLIDGIKDLKNRKDDRYVNNIIKILDKAFDGKPKPIKYCGNKQGERKGKSKSNVDFILESNKTLSVKTNKNKNGKVCPPEIGQPNFKTFDHYFSNSGLYIPPIDYPKFKKLAINHSDFLLPHYINHLLDTDYLLWIYMKKDIFLFQHIQTNLVNSIAFNKEFISFTKDISSWQSSNTVKYHKQSIGEYQLSSSRICLKFRFQLQALLNLLETNFD